MKVEAKPQSSAVQTFDEEAREEEEANSDADCAAWVPWIPHKVRVYGALFLVQLIFASNIVLVRYATRFVPSLAVIIGRQIVCTLALFAVTLKHDGSQRFNVQRCHWKYFLIPGGLLGVCGHLFLVSFGIQSTNAVTATIFATSRPLFSALTIIALGLGKPSKYKFAGLALGMLGETIAMQPWNMSLSGSGKSGSTYTIGCIALGISNACYGMYLVVLKLAIVATIPLPLFLSRVFYVGLLGLIAMLVVMDSLSLYNGTHLIARPRGENTLMEALWNAPPQVWAIAIFGGIIVSPIPYALNGFAIQYVSPIIVALFSNIETPICSALAVFFLSEAVSWHHALGGVIVAAAVLVAAMDHSAAVRHLPPWLDAWLDKEDRQRQQKAVDGVAESG